jgi:hypothetical protein
VQDGLTGLADGTAGPKPDPLASACFRLGWHIEQLFGQFAVPEGPPRAYDLARLPGLSKLTSYDWQRLGLHQADFVITQVTAKVGSPAAAVPDLTADARSMLEATITAGDGTASRRENYRAALRALHVNLLVTLTAANSSYGKAYGLGRALADTTCAHQTREQMAASFEQPRIAQLYVWLDELTSLLPTHAAKAVAQSLRWWQQAVTAALTHQKVSLRTMPASYQKNRVGQPSLLQQATEVFTPHRRRSRDGHVDPPSIESLMAAVATQGAVWRGVLDGDKLCTDLLTPQDYLLAGERLARHYAHLVRLALRTMPWLLALLLFLLAAVVLVLVMIPGSAVARTATGAAAIAGTLSGIWKLTHTRVAPIAAQLERPLWGTELNTAAAEAVTCPPVGAPQDPAWVITFEHITADVITAATHGQTAP